MRPQAKYDRSIELLRRCKEQELVTKTGIMVGIGEEDREVERLMHDVLDGGRAAGGSGLGDQGSDGDVASGGSARHVRDAGCGTRENRPGTRNPEPAAMSPTTPYTPNPTPSDTVDILTIGQYLQPTRHHLPISRWVTPDRFAAFKRLGESLGFRHVESGPLVRSSYHADEQVLSLNP